MKQIVGSLVLSVLSIVSVGAQETPVAFVNAKIFTISGKPIERGTMVVQGGKIVAVGDSRSIKIPDGAKQVDVSGKVLMPGLVDTHSHIGEGAGADGTSPIQPDVRIFDALNPKSGSFQKAQAGGITTVNVMPGSGHLNSGQTLYLKLRDGAKIVEDLAIYDKDGRMMGGIKFANGTNSLRAGGGNFPGTRAKSAALIREQFLKAQEYREKIRKAEGDPAKMPAPDLAMQTLVEVLDGKRVVHFHTHRHDDIMTVLRLKEEFGFRLVLQHVSEAWKVADEIAKAGVASSIIVIDSPGGKLEAMDLLMINGAALEKAGALVGFHTDDPITDSRWFLRSAALAVRNGMSRDMALYGMTLAGAKMLDLDDRIGSIEVGKDADFIILNGDPLSVYTVLEETWIDGKVVFDRSRPEDRLAAVGGFGAGLGRDVHLSCYEELGGQK
jgi:imidazolonepropionase-like amidohydrolase